MTRDKILFSIGLTEIAIGATTLAAVLFSLINHANAKPPNILTFVVATSFLSALLGVGLLRNSSVACKLLIYFSSVVVLSKVLIFTGIIYLSGALETSVPSDLKNGISVAYHLFLIFYLKRNCSKLLFTDYTI